MVTSRLWPNVILFHYFHPLYFHNRLTSSKLKYNLVSTCANSFEKHFIYARRLLNTRKLLILIFLSSFVQRNLFKLCFCCLCKRIFEITSYIFLLQTEQFFYLKNNKGKEGTKQNTSVCGITFFPRVCTTKILIDWLVHLYPSITIKQPCAMLWTNPHPLRSWPFPKLSSRRFDFFPRKFAACSKPPSRDNYRKVSYPRVQQRDQNAGWIHDYAIRVVVKTTSLPSRPHCRLSATLRRVKC